MIRQLRFGAGVCPVRKQVLSALIPMVLASGLAPAVRAQFAQQGSKLVGTGAVGSSLQGLAVALSADGNTAIVGGGYDNGSAGAVWVFTRSNGVWSQQGTKLVGSGAAGFGRSVALSADGNTALEGGTEAAWVFTRTNGQWSQQGGKLTGAGATGPPDIESVALSGDGNTAIVGAVYDNNSTGAAWVYTRTQGVWTQQGPKLVGTGGVGNTYQGTAVALSADGNTAVVGGTGDNNRSGAVWVFIRTNGVWAQQGPKLTGPAGSLVGDSVAMSGDGDTMLVGASGDPLVGSALVFTRSNGVWTQGGGLVGAGAIPNPTGAGQGRSVALSADGNAALVGGPNDNGNMGATWAFRRTGGVWAQQGDKLVGTGAVPTFIDWGSSVAQGSAVAISADGSTAIAGGPVDNGSLGAVWVFAQPPAVLSIAKTHMGDFRQGQLAVGYTVTVSNAPGAGPTSGVVTVTDTLPAGLFLPLLRGTGWSCADTTCTRSDALAAGSSYPPIGVLVAVRQDAPSQVTNQATVTGGGSANATASDPTAIVPPVITGTCTTVSFTFTSGGAIPPDQSCPVAANPITVSPSVAVSTVSGGNWLLATLTPAGILPATLTVSVNPAGLAVGSYTGTVTLIVAANTSLGVPVTLTVTQPAAARLGFYPLAPCRILDTRSSFGDPRLGPGETRRIGIPPGLCGIPPAAQAYSLNVTALPATALTYLTIWPTGQNQPLVSTLNSLDGAVVANAAIVQAGQDGGVSVYVSDATDLILDIAGYFAPPDSNALAFYPTTPCRVADTRQGGGPFGGPAMSGGQTRDFAIPVSACAIPSSAKAYSLNLTAVPAGGLIYLSTWPAGETQPLVSTLNAFDGRVVANAAIVAAGGAASGPGAISVYVSDPSDVIIDINGYFAPPGNPGGLWFYPATPCRIADTRPGQGTTGGFGPPAMIGGQTRSFAIAASGCGQLSAAQAYSLNMTVVPPGLLTYLTTWPAGMPQPLVSTLNAFDGRVAANAAIVPAGQGGAIDVFATDATDLIIDVNGYFAQ